MEQQPKENEDPITEFIESGIGIGSRLTFKYLYLNDEGQPTVRSRADHAIIHVLDNEGKLITEYYYIFM